ncbi:MAG: pentapeptide repeat-containing protein [Spirosomataceae bacterium]
MNNYYQEVFEKIDFTQEHLSIAEYENCRFIDCNFANSNLSTIVFIDCDFKGCNLSMASVNNTAFREVAFTECKLLGLHFNTCNDFLFSVNFKDCLLNLSSFYKLRLKKNKFINCSLHEVDFVESDLSNATFDNCDLRGAIFDKSILEKADFRTAYNYSINPENNRLKKARFSLSGVAGLLDKYGIEIQA